MFEIILSSGWTVYQGGWSYIRVYGSYPFPAECHRGSFCIRNCLFEATVYFMVVFVLAV